MAETVANKSPLVNADPTVGYITAGAAAISAISSGINYFKGADQSDLAGVSGQQKLAAANQGAVARNLMNPQGLTDTQFNRLDRGVTQQSTGLVADITAQARDTISASPLMMDAMVDQAMEKAAAIKEKGMEQVGIFDVETVVQNSLASIQATSQASEAQFKITEQERAIEKERRDIDAQRNEAFQKSMLALSRAIGSSLSGMGGEEEDETGGQTPEEREAVLAQNVEEEKQDKFDTGLDTLFRDVEEEEAQKKFDADIAEEQRLLNLGKDSLAKYKKAMEGISSAGGI